MWIASLLKAIKSPEHRLALLVAVAGDAAQMFALPLFAVALRLLGWHWAFLPTLVAEFTPGLDLFPTWTAAVLYVTLQSSGAGEPEILPPGPAPARRP